MTAGLDTGKYLARLEALDDYVQARGADPAVPTAETAETAATLDAAYERYAALRQDGPDAETQEMEAGS